MLSRDAILEADDLARERVAVPEWGKPPDDFVFVRGLTGAERDAFEQSKYVRVPDSDDLELSLKNLRARLAVLSVCDEAGKRLFADDDAALLGGKNAVALARIYEVAARLSGLTVEAREADSKN